MTFPLICLGGHGVVSVVSNLFPGLVVEMVDNAIAGRVQRARELHFTLLPMFKAAFIESNPGPIKYAMGKMDIAAGPLRLPMVEVSEASKAALDAVLEQYAG